jgi:nucleoside-diphosphate-sugar epimerase
MLDDFIKCDFTLDASVNAAFDAVKRRYGNHLASVIHLAGHYDLTGEPSEMYEKLTVQGTRRLLKKLREFEIEQFVFPSTVLVMKPAREEGERLTEISPFEDEPWDYPKSKIRAVKLIRQERGSVKTVILRIGGVYNEDTRAAPLARQIAGIYERQFESRVYPGDAAHGRSYVHLEDLADCVRRVVERRNELSETEVFIVAEPDLMSYEKLQNEIGRLIHGREWKTLRIPKFIAKAGAWAHNLVEEETAIKPWMIDLADNNYPVAIEHAREIVGWNPQKTLGTMLPEMIKRLKENPARWYKVNKLQSPADKREKSLKMPDTAPH